MKNFLYVFRHAPYGSSMGQEGLDALLVAPAFESIKVAALFMDDGVYQIKSGQNNNALHIKQYTRTFSVLEDFGVEQVYVHRDALTKRGLSEVDLNINAQVIDNTQLRELFQQQYRIFGF